MHRLDGNFTPSVIFLMRHIYVQHIFVPNFCNNNVQTLRY